MNNERFDFNHTLFPIITQNTFVKQARSIEEHLQFNEIWQAAEIFKEMTTHFNAQLLNEVNQERQTIPMSIWDLLNISFSASSYRICEAWIYAGLSNESISNSDCVI